MRIGVIGSGSWATALVKLLTDNGHTVNWCLRSRLLLEQLSVQRHNPHYLSTVYFELSLLHMDTDVVRVVESSDWLVMAVPSAYVADTLQPLAPSALSGKKFISAVKGILPQEDLLLNEFLLRKYAFPQNDYFTIMGPCHAEEVAAEKLSYLTFSGMDAGQTAAIASCFSTTYLNTVINQDIYGVQYAAVLKNIYALAAGMAHGLDYGDNFLSVLIANCADEMAVFLKAVGIKHIEVGVHEGSSPVWGRKSPNYAASVYLGDLLVTCYSLYSRNRTFGKMIGKGYTVKAALQELSMVAEGYSASRCIYRINQQIKAQTPVAETMYRILWEELSPKEGFLQIESILV
jgi:glycerol-3-phosphate dehydrogenase (NAD(P)+)